VHFLAEDSENNVSYLNEQARLAGGTEVLILPSALLAIPPEVANPGLWEKIIFLFGSAALAKASLTIVILAALGFAVYYMNTKKS
jgi:hypothetical protein